MQACKNSHAVPQRQSRSNMFKRYVSKKNLGVATLKTINSQFSHGKVASAKRGSRLSQRDLIHTESRKCTPRPLCRVSFRVTFHGQRPRSQASSNLPSQNCNMHTFTCKPQRQSHPRFTVHLKILGVASQLQIRKFGHGKAVTITVSQ